MKALFYLRGRCKIYKVFCYLRYIRSVACRLKSIGLASVLKKGYSSCVTFVPTKRRYNWKKDCRDVCLFCILLTLFRFFVYDYYIIPSSSMFPTLLIGDVPFVNKWIYGYTKHSIWFSPNVLDKRIFSYRKPIRGEVIVFKSFDNNTNIIKRVIAIPGDKVSMSGGIVSINGRESYLEFKGRLLYNDYKLGSRYNLLVFKEMLPMSSNDEHSVAYDERFMYSSSGDFSEVTVPEGYYFVMGDNRDHSGDSRYGLGFIPEYNIIGKAIFTIYSIDSGVKLWEFWRWIQNIRYCRILKKIE